MTPRLVAASALCFLVPCMVPHGAAAALMNGPAFTNPALLPQPFAAGQDGTVDPVLSFTGVPGYGDITVSYGPYFAGQSASSFLVPPVAVSGSPSAPFGLDTGPGATFDTSFQTIVEPDAGQEALGGLPAVASNGFGGPVAILFSAPVAGITLTVGAFDQAGSTTIEAFTAAGASLGAVVNTSAGFQTFNLSDSAGAFLSGLLITSDDPAGFGITGVGIAAGGATPVPAPAAAALPGLLVLLRLARRRRR